jgi:hypothetical protein
VLVSIDRYPLSLLPCTVKYWRLVTLREAVSYEEEDTYHMRRRIHAMEGGVWSPCVKWCHMRRRMQVYQEEDTCHRRRRLVTLREAVKQQRPMGLSPMSQRHAHMHPCACCVCACVCVCGCECKSK